ncbi:MAG TPA: methyltransferase domain-containing protein [Gammaproteobacteria bacterium]|nr:methyltransferase domain-containing protein [Gammaproteobacteria bacterium]
MEATEQRSAGAPDNRTYYDEFARHYDDRRARGYHKLIDDQATGLVRRVGEGKTLLEVGCGTGLILERVAKFARRAEGVDVSPGMVEYARRRGLDVRVADASSLPYPDAEFDVAFSFKVLAHVSRFDEALAEMLRVVRPGGHIVFDIYNRHSLRYAMKRLFGPKHTSQRFAEDAILTRFLTPSEMNLRLPANTRLVSRSGIRIVTPHAALLELPALGPVWQRIEWSLMDTPLASFAGFVVYTLQKAG